MTWLDPVLCQYSVPRPLWVNSSPPSAAYMRQWTGPSLVQVMACRLFDAEPLPEQMLIYCQLDPWEQVSVKFNQNFCLSYKKMHFKMPSAKMAAILSRGRWVNILRPRQMAATSWRHFQMHFLEWKCMIFDKISMDFVGQGSINNIPALVQIMAWHRLGDKPLSEPMMISLLTHMIYVTELIHTSQESIVEICNDQI